MKTLRKALAAALVASLAGGGAVYAAEPVASEEALAREQAQMLLTACAREPSRALHVYSVRNGTELGVLTCPEITELGRRAGLEVPASPPPGMEGTGEAQLPLSPFSLACFLLIFGTNMLFAKGCDTPGANNPRACHLVNNWVVGGAGGFACLFV
jgi:hypothetical protein